MIGFFDSGIGGLTVYNDVIRVLDGRNTVYLGDTSNAPYGDKTHDELVDLTWRGVSWLFNEGCELVILACNSASASALREIQQEKLGPDPQKRVLGVIRPTAEYIARTGFERVLILSTAATKKSGAYAKEIHKINPSIAVTSHACPAWGPMIEEGRAGSAEMTAQVLKDLSSFSANDFDAVLLACTHYPYVKNDIEDALPGIPVLDQGPIIADSLQDYLKRHPEIEKRISRNSYHLFFTTAHGERSSQSAKSAFGIDVEFQSIQLQ